MTRQEILAIAKPILFNGEMVRAIQEGRKTETRRVAKELDRVDMLACRYVDGDIQEPIGYPVGHISVTRRAPYQPGDILWVRETWCDLPVTPGGHMRGHDVYYYKADGDLRPEGWRRNNWRPSIHMPKEAVRLFLRVKSVRLEWLQDITEEQAQAEGIRGFNLGMGECGYAANADGITYFDNPIGAFARLWDDCYATPHPVKSNGIIAHYESYPWRVIRETRTYKGLPWEVYGNPWVWVITFERVTPR